MRNFIPKPASRLRPRLSVAVLALLTLAMILAGLVFIPHIATRQNEREADAEKDRVMLAVDANHAGVVQDVMRLASSPHLGAGPADIGSLDQVLLLNTMGVGSISVLAGTQAANTDLNRSLLDFTRSISTGAASSVGGMVASGDLFDVFATKISASVASEEPIGVQRVIVGLRQVDARYLNQIGIGAKVKGLDLIHRASDVGGGTGSWSGGSWRGFGLIWEPTRPGNRFMLAWTVIVMAITLLAALVIIFRARREFGVLHAREARAVEASNSDWLSGLPNRLVFNHALERDLQAIKHGGGRLALFYLDVDRFKDINDSFGLETGDRMIQEVTRRIETVMHEGQSLARFEGDAFSILLPGIGSAVDCERFAESIQAAMQAPFDISGAAVTLSLSIGIAVAPNDASERAELIRLANLALYRAKREGRDRFAFYKPDLHEEWRRRTVIEQQLRQAIAHGGLVLRYQPIVDCGTGKIVCAEALVRWNHPAEGIISPDRFIEMAEDRGLILPLGEWVMREACTAAKQWPTIRIAVNVSPIQLRQRDFVAMVMGLIEDTGIDPSRLELELTEGVLVDHAEDVLATMAALRAHGIRLAIDDFGTGYSSLIYLRRFAMDKLKIDRAFLEEVEPGSDGAILLTSVVQLGRALGLTVTAEGVETAAQCNFLEMIGCHQLQGYLISRPLDDAEFTAFLHRHKDGTPFGRSMRAVA